MKELSKWESPKLILLGRGNPEEHVLGKCILRGSPEDGIYVGDETQYDS